MAYACASDEKTFDNSPNGRNSLFTSHLLKHVTEPNLKVEAMMSRISDGIYRDTNGEMLSHRQVSFRTSDIYFNRADAKGMHSNRTCAYRSCLQQISHPFKYNINGIVINRGALTSPMSYMNWDEDEW